MMKIKIVAFQEYKNFCDDVSELVGNETIYPEEFLEPLIKTFTFDDINMTNYYFNIAAPELNIYLQPKYVHSFSEKCIIVSNEIYNQYFGPPDIEYDFHLVYNIPCIDVLSLKRISGDFPQDCSIDIWLTNYLESCNIINHLQGFTLYFDCNESPLKNYIKFRVSKITYKEDTVKRLEDRIEELNLTMELNKHLNVETEFQNKVIHFHWYDSAMNKDNDKIVGLVGNNEVNIDFVSDPVPPAPLSPAPLPLEKISKETFKEKGLVMDENAVKPLTKEELRAMRLNALDPSRK